MPTVVVVPAVVTAGASLLQQPDPSPTAAPAHGPAEATNPLHTSTTAPVAANAQHALPEAAPAASQQQTRGVRKSSRKGSGSAEQSAAAEAPLAGQGKAGRKRARNEDRSQGGVAAAGETPPKTGSALLAEAAAVALPQTEQKASPKTMMNPSRVGHQLLCNADCLATGDICMLCGNFIACISYA